MGLGFGFGFGIMDMLFPFVFIGIFVVVIATFIVTAISGVKTWNKNNNSPRLTVEARIVSKRMDVSHRAHRHAGNTTNYTTSSTSYYVTFEVESGDRMEMSVSGTDYGMLVEGDMGRLSFQGTRYLGFERGRYGSRW